MSVAMSWINCWPGKTRKSEIYEWGIPLCEYHI